MVGMLLLCWGVVYIYVVLGKLHKFIQVRRCLRKLHAFLEAYSNCTSPNEEKDTYIEELDALLRYYPIISKYCGYYLSLSYSDTDVQCYNNSVKIYYRVLMERNYIYHSLIKSLNPFNSIELLIKLPANIVKQFGFKLGKISSLVVNLLGWLAAYLLSMFSDEIKAFLISIFERS